VAGTAERDDEAWRAQRRDAALEHAAALQRRKAAESAEAAGLLAAFVAAARERGLPTTELRAQSANGATYRTGLRGWYLKRNRSLAVDEQGRYYHLDVPASLTARFRGVTVQPTDPPIAVGVGARDGESMSMAELLQLRLEAGTSWG
jgi:hypothetical protein